MTKTKKAKIIKFILSALWWLAVVLLALLLINVLGAKIRGEVPRVFGYSVMQIVTGSMEDTLPTGSYILVKQIDPRKIKKEDIISFYSEEQAIYGLPNTHRVMDIVEGENGLEFITRGDANSIDDQINAKADRLIGVYVTSLTFLGELTSFLNGGGMFWIMLLLWLACLGMIGYTVYKKLKTEERSSETEQDPTFPTDQASS